MTHVLIRTPSVKCMHCGEFTEIPVKHNSRESFIQSSPINSSEGKRTGLQHAPTVGMIEEQIIKVQGILQGLKAKHRQIKTYDARNSLFSPVQKLPLEILGKIFAETRRQGKIDIGFHQKVGIWHLGQVCRLWKNALLFHRSLWSQITITRYLSCGKKKIIPRLSSCLQRSMPLPLTIEMDLTYCPRDPNLCSQIFATLASHCDRWKEVILCLQSPVILSPCQLKNLPKLHSFVLHGGTIDDHIEAFEFSPHLTRLEFHGVQGTALNGPWHQLTSLSLGPPVQFGRLLEILKEAENLVTFQWSESPRTWNHTLFGPNGPNSFLRLPRLQSLIYDFNPWGLRHFLLDTLEVPLLTELHIRHTDKPPTEIQIIEPVIALARRSGCTISSLTLEGVTQRAGIALFPEFPLVKSLIWRKSWDSIIPLLYWGIRHRFLPSLESLTVDERYPEEADISLLIESRNMGTSQCSNLCSPDLCTCACVPILQVHITPDELDAVYINEFKRVGARTGVDIILGSSSW